MMNSADHGTVTSPTAAARHRIRPVPGSRRGSCAGSTPTPPTSSATTDIAYTSVKDMIISGVLPAGEMVSERKIAAKIGTSRTPVREAFLRLEGRGMDAATPQEGSVDGAHRCQRARTPGPNR